MYPMTFPEFLLALGRDELIDWVSSQSSLGPFPAVIANQLEYALRLYYFVGGMPEAVKTFISGQDFPATRQVQKDILRAYLLDFSKYAEPSEAIRISAVWESIPRHLAKENKKFMFSAVRKSARAREYEGALQWLIDAGLVYKCLNCENPEIPLFAHTAPATFKVYMIDIGLLGAMTDLNSRVIVQGDELFSTFKGAFAESLVAQMIIAWEATSNYSSPLIYWTSGNSAEVDFLVDIEGKIVPIEVKSGKNTRAKSLALYAKRHMPSLMVRASLQQQQHNGALYDCPISVLPWLPERIGLLAKA